MSISGTPPLRVSSGLIGGTPALPGPGLSGCFACSHQGPTLEPEVHDGRTFWIVEN